MTRPDPNEKDRLYVGGEAPEPFEFNEPVARVFEDMLERSVPLYDECQTAAIDWCLRFVKRSTQIYDLGCSTGTLLLRLSGRLPADLGVRLVGVDSSAPMLEKARRRLAASLHPIKWVEADLNADFGLDNASVAVLNYTLQFIPPQRRARTLKTIHAGLNPGGLLILIEKVKSPEATFDRTYVELHHAFKKARGYSDLEIARKRDALEKVLLPLSVGDNINLLKEAGFSAVELFFKWNNFAGFVAMK